MRDRTIDGFRAVAALGVVFAHAANYRFASFAPHLLQKLSDPYAQTSVDIFFVISGFVITSLLLNDERGTAAFYVRRVCRIIPPLAIMLLTVGLLKLTDPASLAMASTFTCNIGDCKWFVAHTWSLSVEEQFYLVWPALLLLDPRPRSVAIGIGCLLLGYALFPTGFHSNFLSFACIGVGALIAMTKPIIRSSNVAWLGTCAFLVVAPLYLQPLQVLTPLAIAYLLFGCPPLVKTVLATAPFQIVGMASYSLYLWQQLFLGKSSTLPLWELPVIVILSVILIERPFIKLGRKLSNKILQGRLNAAKLVEGEDNRVDLHAPWPVKRVVVRSGNSSRAHHKSWSHEP